VTREEEIRAACGGIEPLALFCLEQDMAPDVAGRLANVFFEWVEGQAAAMGRYASMLVLAERCAPGSMMADDNETKH
jgi:hypothetical protein